MSKHSSLFLSLFVCISLVGQPHSPGGVSSPDLWFQTVPQSADLQGRYLWQDFSGDSLQLRLYSSSGIGAGNEYSATRAQTRTYNFNPALDLSAANASKQFAVNHSNLSQATVISVWGPDFADFNQDMFLYSLNGRSGEGYIFTKDKIVHSNESGKGVFDYGKDEGKDLIYQSADEEANVNKFRERALRIATYNRVLQPNTTVWGERNQAIISIGEVFHPSYSFNSSTYPSGDFNNRYFYGYTPEFIIYSRVLTPLERRRAETYLAVKYGLPLEVSYIGSNNTLMWDIEANSGYNARITGYGRDDVSRLYQKMATSSYEEAPYFADAYGDLWDSYDLNNSYNLPSRYRLLVIGRQPANPLADGKYVLFGDNDAAISASPAESFNGIHIMNRRWLLNTNIAPATEQDKVFVWNAQDLDVYTDCFKTKATKIGSSVASFGSLTSATPLLADDGYFSWTITGTRRGPLTVKFGTNNPQITSGEQDYGYYISYAGLVYKIIKGEKQSTAIETVYSNQKIEVGKEGNTVYLRVNGVRTHARDIAIEAADAGKTFYGSILISKYNNDDIVLSDIRQGGFSDTGNQLELSYIAERAYEFRNYREGGKTCLLIDRTGTGDFSSEHTDFIPADELDESRYKIIFNNVFWDTDGNGKDMFTFGYRQSNLVAIVTPSPPTCRHDSLQSDGSIIAKIKQGFKGFSYHLQETQTGIEHSGTFYSDSLNISHLPAGTYSFTLSELGGFNLSPRQSGIYANAAIGSTCFNSTSNAYLEWTVSTGAQSSAGMSINASLQSAPNGQIIGYGLHVNNGYLYQIDDGVILPTALAAVAQGNRIKVERVSNKIYFKINDTELLSVDMRTADRLRYNYPLAQVVSGSIYNLRWNRMSSAASWLTTDNLVMEQSAGDSFTRTLILSSDCQYNAPPSGASQSPEFNRLSVYYKDPNNLRAVTARIDLPKPEAVSLMVFNIGGSHILSVDIPKGSNISEAEIRLPAAGVYVIKAFTAEGEYSAKAVSN